MRHKVGLPVRGQSTRRNARTRKGKRKTIANKKSKQEIDLWLSKKPKKIKLKKRRLQPLRYKKTSES